MTPFVYTGQRIELRAGRPLVGRFEHACYRLFLQFDGTSRITRPPDSAIQLRPGQLFIADPGDELVSHEVAHVIRISFDLWPRARHLRDRILVPANERPQPPLAQSIDMPCDGRIPPALQTQATDIALELSTMRPKKASAVLRANAGLGRLLAAYMDHLAGPDDDSVPPEGFQHQTEVLLMRHATDGGTVSDTANALGVTSAHLCKRYRQLTGSTPGRFLMRYRMSLAKKLLEDDTMSIAEIAQRIGCGSPSNFRAHFRKQTGLSPRDWRRRNKRH